MADNDDNSSLPPRPAFGRSDKCLHCLVWDVIRQNSPIIEGSSALDAQLIIGNLVDVVAEVIAAIPERGERREYIKLAESRLGEQVSEFVRAGNHPGMRRMRTQ